MEKSKKKGKKIIIIFLIIIALIVSGGVFLINGAKSITQQTTKMETAVIKNQDLINSINVSGNLKGENTIKIASPVTAKIKTLNVGVGDYVKKGDILCIFDSSDLQKEYDLLKTNVELKDEMNQNSHNINERQLQNAKDEKEHILQQAQQTINEAIAARDNAYNKYNNLIAKCDEERIKKEEAYNIMLASEDEVSLEINTQNYQAVTTRLEQYEMEKNTLGEQLSSYDSNVQTAQNAYASAERSADASIQSMQDILNAEKFSVDLSTQAQLDTLSEQIEACTVIAQHDGIVTSVNAVEGSFPLSDYLITIEDDSKLKMTVQIKENDILNVKEGMKAIIKTNATGEEEFIGTVTKVVNVFSSANPVTQEEGGYTAEITLNEKDKRLLLGMNAKVKIILNETKDVLSVPYDSIVQNDDGKDVVYIVKEESEGVYTANEIIIEKGVEADYYTEIVSGDLKEGDIVITSAKKISDGQVINITTGEENG